MGFLHSKSFQAFLARLDQVIHRLVEGLALLEMKGERLIELFKPILEYLLHYKCNLFLDALDRELERRGHCFVRYADDCNIYVRSLRAGERVLASITRFLCVTLKLKVNAAKSTVAHPWERTFLGFSFTRNPEPRRRLAPQTVQRFKRRVRKLTRRNRGVSFVRMVDDLNRYLRGWCGYFGHCQTPSVLQAFDSWLRRRLRCVVWKHWKKGKTRYSELRKRGVGHTLAAKAAGSSRGPWHLSRSHALHTAFPNDHFDTLGLIRLANSVR